MPSNHDLRQDVTIRDILFHLKKLTERLEALEKKAKPKPKSNK